MNKIWDPKLSNATLVAVNINLFILLFLLLLAETAGFVPNGVVPIVLAIVHQFFIYSLLVVGYRTFKSVRSSSVLLPLLMISSLVSGLCSVTTVGPRIWFAAIAVTVILMSILITRVVLEPGTSSDKS